MPRAERITLAADSIGNLFSKFDDRPISKRDLSGDFISELTRKAYEAGEFKEVEIRVKKKTKKAELGIVKERIGSYFFQHEERLRKEQWAHRFQGTAYVVLGGALLTAQAKVYSEGYGLVSLLLLPAGWLALFLGAEFIVADWRLGPEYRAAKKLKEAGYTVSD